MDITKTESRPQGWSRRSNASYYKQSFAEEIKVLIDGMLESRKDIILRYSSYCLPDVRNGISKNTLYLRVNQSVKFLLDKLDPDGKYMAWYRAVKIKITPAGIEIRFGEESRNSKLIPMVYEEIVTQREDAEWRKDMENWLESTDVRPFVRKHLALSNEEVEKLQSELGELKGIAASVKNESISIIRDE